jgi:hypothetical protein
LWYSNEAMAQNAREGRRMREENSRPKRDLRSPTRLVGHICEHCLDAPALLVQPAPWGGEMGVCGACYQDPTPDDTEPQAG